MKISIPSEFGRCLAGHVRLPSTLREIIAPIDKSYCEKMAQAPQLQGLRHLDL
jgi:hypothetical protein